MSLIPGSPTHEQNHGAAAGVDWSPGAAHLGYIPQQRAPPCPRTPHMDLVGPVWTCPMWTFWGLSELELFGPVRAGPFWAYPSWTSYDLPGPNMRTMDIVAMLCAYFHQFVNIGIDPQLYQTNILWLNTLWMISYERSIASSSLLREKSSFFGIYWGYTFSVSST